LSVADPWVQNRWVERLLRFSSYLGTDDNVDRRDVTGTDSKSRLRHGPGPWISGRPRGGGRVGQPEAQARARPGAATVLWGCQKCPDHVLHCRPPTKANLDDHATVAAVDDSHTCFVE
jgi:hypothetical protein